MLVKEFRNRVRIKFRDSFIRVPEENNSRQLAGGGRGRERESFE